LTGVTVRLHLSHRTFAVTVAFSASLNVHVFVLLPPLEHAPDHTASRPFETLSVMAVPPANAAEPVVPTDTAIPAGFDDTTSWFRPVAVTVSVIVCPGGFTVSVAVRVALPARAVIVTIVDAVTELVAIAKVALVAPWGTVTGEGTVASALLLDTVTANPPAGAALVSRTVACDAVPPTTVVGLTVSDDNDAGCAAGAETLNTALRLAPPAAPVMVADVDEVTDTVVTVKVALVAPSATATLPGTVAAAGLLLLSVTTAPPAGAALVSATVPCELLPPTTEVGLSAIPDRAGGGGVLGFTTSVAD
jgi:hypothetical protein